MADLFAVAVTLRTPWGWAVAFLGKPLENRTWRPNQRFVGKRIGIHAGKVPALSAAVDWQEITEAIEWMHGRGLCVEESVTPRTLTQMSSAIVATARLGRPVTKSDSPWFTGPCGWPLEERFTLPEPVPCRGAQGLWQIPPAVLSRVRGFEIGAGVPHEEAIGG